MAKKLEINGYGQLELNQVAFRRDGRIEAQCALDETDFATIPAENGMILAVDNINRVVKFPEGDFPVALNYSSEHMYDERANGLKNFSLKRGEYLPRLGYLAVGDKFTTNCLSSDEYETVEAAVEAAYTDGTTLYGTTDAETGRILVTATKPASGLVLLVVNGTGAGSMPDGQPALKFQVIKV